MTTTMSLRRCLRKYILLDDWGSKLVVKPRSRNYLVEKLATIVIVDIHVILSWNFEEDEGEYIITMTPYMIRISASE